MPSSSHESGRALRARAEETPAVEPGKAAELLRQVGEPAPAGGGRDAEVASVLEDLRAGRRSAAGLDLQGARLVEEDLDGLDLAGVDLSGADLSRARLRGANLMRARLAGAALGGACLEGAQLSGADLSGAGLQGADLRRAGLGLARLGGASLCEADLSEASLVESDLSGADLRLAKLRDARAREADLSGADFSRTDLRGVELVRCRVERAVFDGADLRGARLDHVRGYRRASWMDVDVRDVDFTGAYLCRRHILDQNYLNEFRNQGRWAHFLYVLWWVTSDCGRSLLRWAAFTCLLALLFAGLYTRVGVDYGDYPTALSPIYFSVVTLTTLGFGDVTPSSTGAQVVAMAEVLTGYMMLGGLLSIMSNKLARRAE